MFHVLPDTPCARYEILTEPRTIKPLCRLSRLANNQPGAVERIELQARSSPGTPYRTILIQAPLGGGTFFQLPQVQRPVLWPCGLNFALKTFGRRRRGAPLRQGNRRTRFNRFAVQRLARERFV